MVNDIFGIVTFLLVIETAVLVAAARILRAPMFFMAITSQANVGGPVSAPMVAEILPARSWELPAHNCAGWQVNRYRG